MNVRVNTPSVQHRLNSLHVMCRLKDLGVSSRLALFLSSIWETLFHPIIYYKGKGKGGDDWVHDSGHTPYIPDHQRLREKLSHNQR